MTVPLASVIINNYNYARFLGDAIESALDQSYPAVEVVVVDDGSLDDSAQVIAAYGDRVHAVFKPNEGMGSTYNAGFSACHGEVVCMLDADDFLLPSAVASAVKALQQPECCKVHWPLFAVDERGQRTGSLIPHKPLPEGDLRNRIRSAGPDACLSPPTSGNAFAREFLAEVLPMPVGEYRQHADSYLTTLAFAAGTTARLTEPQACYRLHGRNDYACQPSAEKNRRNLMMYQHRCSALQTLLQRRGERVDRAAWTEHSANFQWMRRFDRAAQRLHALLPEGTCFILVDDASWSDGWGNSPVLADREHLPFIERAGMYQGPPPDDATAIAELERLRAGGARFLVVAWHSFWWLTHYPAFAAYLRERYRCLNHDDCSVVFEL